MRGGQTQEGCPIKKARKAFVVSYRDGRFYGRASCTEDSEPSSPSSKSAPNVITHHAATDEPFKGAGTGRSPHCGGGGSWS